jgi:hypothetical protein
MIVVRQRFQTEQHTREIPYQWCKKVTIMTHIILTEKVPDRKLWMVMRNAFRQHLLKCLPVKKRTNQLPVTDCSIIETVGQ